MFDPPGGFIPKRLLDYRVPMRDGVTLSADIYLPPDGDGPWPAVLQRTPYDNITGAGLQFWPTIAAYFAAHGYAFVSQDVRGRYDSGGEWEPFVNEGRDGYDTVEWIARQPWSDGKVGFMGASYGGFVQWAAAAERPPHLAAMVSTAAPGRWMEELPYRFGSFQAGETLLLLNLVGGRTLQTIPTLDMPRIVSHRPLRDADIALGRTNTAWRTYLEHATFDSYYRQISLLGRFHEIDLPVLHITGWFDGDQWGQLFYWHGMANDSPASGRQQLIVGPWHHVGTVRPTQQVGGRDFGADSLVEFDRLHLDFFNRWLRGIDGDAEREPRVRIFVMGTNVWRDESHWPPPRMALTPLYLGSDGDAASLTGDGTLAWEKRHGGAPFDRFTYDPADPTPSHADLDEWLVYGEFPALDNRWRLDRRDVLVYTSEPLASDVELSGHPIMVLYASSDCPDTDWHVTLCDVWPDARCDELTSGCMRAAYRHGLEAAPSPLDPEKVYEFRIELRAISNVWQRGHRLRVTVASANYPESARNPNTNARPGHDNEWRVAHNTVMHSTEQPSHLLAPIVRL